MRHSYDLVFGKIVWLLNDRMQRQIARGSDNDPTSFASPDSY
jgi:hypothetical protein